METNDSIFKPTTNEETKEETKTVDVQSSAKTPSKVNASTQPVVQPTTATTSQHTVVDTPQPTTVTTPQPTQKEVKTVAEETKDPKGMFDYTDCKTHVVKEDETLFDVAQQYNVALQQLRYFNHVNKATMHIKTGQTLYIPKEPVYVPTGK